jgi:hypothetical protein
LCKTFSQHLFILFLKSIPDHIYNVKPGKARAQISDLCWTGFLLPLMMRQKGMAKFTTIAPNIPGETTPAIAL